LEKPPRQAGTSFVRYDANSLNARNIVSEIPRRGDCPNNNGNVPDDVSRLTSDDRVNRRRAVPSPVILENTRPIGETEVEQFPNLSIIIRVQIVFFNDLNRLSNRCIGFRLGHFANHNREKTNDSLNSIGHEEIGQCRNTGNHPVMLRGGGLVEIMIVKRESEKL